MPVSDRRKMANVALLFVHCPFNRNGNMYAHSLSLEQAERLVQIQAQMDSLYVGGMELNERMNSIVSEFERENNERFAARYRTFVLERNNSYYVVAGLALSISLLAIVLYILIHRDLNRRLRYEREFEQSDNRNRELLRSRKELMASVPMTCVLRWQLSEAVRNSCLRKAMVVAGSVIWTISCIRPIICSLW